MPACAADVTLHPMALRLAGALVALIALGSAPAHPASNARPVQPSVAEIPVPPPRPESGSKAPAPEDADLAAEVPSPPPRPTDLNVPPPAVVTTLSPEDLAEESACRERLATLGVRFEPLPAIANGQCGAAHPLRISALPDGLEISSPATLVCAAAEALARWTREVVALESGRHLEAQPTRIAIGTSYECRTQNRRIGAKLSEHAFANGVDISGFEFKGRKAVQVGDHPADSPEALFQNAIRTQACAYFTTVLGPGSDAAHATHLHLDLRGRGRGFRLCQ